VPYTVEAQYVGDGSLALIVNGRRHHLALARRGRERLVAIEGETYAFASEAAATAAHSLATVTPPEVTAPMPGKVLQVFVQVGDRVAAGDGLVVLEAMKMENRLVAEAAASVADVRVAEGDMVEGGQVLVVLSYDEPE